MSPTLVNSLFLPSSDDIDPTLSTITRHSFSKHLTLLLNRTQPSRQTSISSTYSTIYSSTYSSTYSKHNLTDHIDDINYYNNDDNNIHLSHQQPPNHSNGPPLPSSVFPLGTLHVLSFGITSSSTNRQAKDHQTFQLHPVNGLPCPSQVASHIISTELPGQAKRQAFAQT